MRNYFFYYHTPTEGQRQRNAPSYGVSVRLILGAVAMLEIDAYAGKRAIWMRCGKKYKGKSAANAGV